jgi:ATP-dependent DNA ligase
VSIHLDAGNELVNEKQPVGFSGQSSGWAPWLVRRYGISDVTADHIRPMPLSRIAEPFDHPDWTFELKHDGFRALAHVDRYECTLTSRRRHVYKQFPMLETELAHAVRATSCILDGEIVALAPDGRSKFYDLLFRREWPHFIAFDALMIDGEDLRGRPLLERKRRLRAIMPRPNVHARILYHDHIDGRGVALFDAVRGNDLEGGVAKWKQGPYYTDGQTTSWLKIRNPEYSQIEGRRDVFGPRRSAWSRSRAARPVLCPELIAPSSSTFKRSP